MKDNFGTMDMPRYFDHYGVSYTAKQVGALTYYNLPECLFDANHKAGEAAICQSPNYPYLTYACYHNSCSGYKWRRLDPDVGSCADRAE